MIVVITGGSGFFGKSILAYFSRNNPGFEKITVLSRYPEKLEAVFDKNSFPFKINLVAQDIREPIELQGPVDYIIHAAAESSTSLGMSNPFLMRNVVVEGTKSVLEYARDAKVKRVLFISSGAVYGKQPSDLSHIPEDYGRAPNTLNPLNSYGCAKRQAENLCALYNYHYGVDFVVARCFAFVGPYLPLDAHFAIGNFIRDGLNGSPIIVKGDGTPYRSYLYADDLAEWLWTILLKGESSEAYNVGSDEAISINELAFKVSECCDNNPTVVIKKEPLQEGISERYVPSVEKAETHLDLKATTSLIEGISKTLSHHKPSVFAD